MATETTVSPSYPPESATARGVYRHIGLLRAWALEELTALRPLIPPKYAEQLVEPDEVDTEERWTGVSLADQYGVYRYMQQIREGWDATLRLHEDAWDARASLQRRFNLVVAALNVLAAAFTPAEVSEMRSQQARDEYERNRKKLDRKLKKLLDREPDDEDEPAPDEADEADAGWSETPQEPGDE